MPPLIEIVVEDVEGARIAAQEGADSIELCVNLDVGGLTPPAPLMKEVCTTVKATNPRTLVHILILNKPSGFVPAIDDVEALRQGIKDAIASGADGVVFGALNDRNELNGPVLKELLEEAGPLRTTFHRAFDAILDQKHAIDQLIAFGFTRLLTSGRPGLAARHTAHIKQLVCHAAGRITIVAGSGIRANNLLSIARETESPVLHMSCRVDDFDKRGFRPTDPQTVQKVIRLCRSLAS